MLACQQVKPNKNRWTNIFPEPIFSKKKIKRSFTLVNILNCYFVDLVEFNS